MQINTTVTFVAETSNACVYNMLGIIVHTTCDTTCDTTYVHVNTDYEDTVW